ncbi:MAG: HAMP domain-containing histidine kinase [Chloroflexi bacterium]|nr:HAMP domain-containing histidine kinase [Chloroflexota bacterium]
MPDGAATSLGGDPADQRALAADGRLIRNVRWRLVLWSGLTTLVVLAILAIALYAVASGTLEVNGIKQLEARAAAFRQHPEPGGGPGQGFAFGGSSSGTFALLADDTGEPVAIGRPVLVPDGLPVIAGIDAARSTGTDFRVVTVTDTSIRVRTEAIRSRIGKLYIQVIQDRTAEQQTLDAIRRVLLVGGALVVLVAVGFGALYGSRAMVPIRESLVQQRAALRRQREFAADASHELRTPLTVIRSSVEHLRRNRGEGATESAREALDDIDAEVGHLTALVEDLLLLARSDSGAIALTRLPVDLGDVAADGTGALVTTAAARQVQLELDPEPAIVDGDHARLRQLVMILVDNAIRHAPRGGTVRVRIRSEEREAVLEVDDDGPGIRPDDIDHVFERFWRAPGAAPGGTGLGLAIAKSIVDLHDGRIEVANRPDGGARFVVRLRAAGTPPISASDSGPILAIDPPA